MLTTIFENTLSFNTCCTDDTCTCADPKSISIKISTDDRDGLTATLSTIAYILNENNIKIDESLKYTKYTLKKLLKERSLQKQNIFTLDEGTKNQLLQESLPNEIRQALLDGMTNSYNNKDDVPIVSSATFFGKIMKNNR